MSCQDLVVFNYARVEDSLKLESREFTFFQQDLKIQQKWQEGGKGGSSIGFGCSVYDCSFVLAKYMEEHPDEIRGKHCVELGCGPGLTGIACSLAQPASLVATDGDDISVELTRENIKRNLALASEACMCTAERLLWGDAADLQKFPLHSYDVVLAADVVALPYEGAYKALMDTMQHLLAPHGSLWLCYQQRHVSEKGGFFTAFHQEFHVQRIEQQDLHKDFQNTLVPIQLFKATRKQDVQL